MKIVRQQIRGDLQRTGAGVAEPEPARVGQERYVHRLGHRLVQLPAQGPREVVDQFPGGARRRINEARSRRQMSIAHMMVDTEHRLRRMLHQSTQMPKAPHISNVEHDDGIGPVQIFGRRGGLVGSIRSREQELEPVRKRGGIGNGRANTMGSEHVPESNFAPSPISVGIHVSGERHARARLEGVQHVLRLAAACCRYRDAATPYRGLGFG